MQEWWAHTVAVVVAPGKINHNPRRSRLDCLLSSFSQPQRLVTVPRRSYYCLAVNCNSASTTIVPRTRWAWGRGSCTCCLFELSRLEVVVDGLRAALQIPTTSAKIPLRSSRWRSKRASWSRRRCRVSYYPTSISWRRCFCGKCSEESGLLPADLYAKVHASPTPYAEGTCSYVPARVINVIIMFEQLPTRRLRYRSSDLEIHSWG